METVVDPEAGLSDEIVNEIGDFDAGKGSDLGGELLRLARSALTGLSGTLRDGLLCCGVILGAVLLCGVLDDERQDAAIRLMGTLAIVSVCTGSLRSMISLAGQTLGELRDYGLVLLPGLASLTTISGGAATGAAVYAGGALYFDLLLRLSSGLILPLCWVFVATCAADCAIGSGMLSPLADFLKWLASGLLKWTSYLFTGYLALSGVLAGVSDTASLRAARVALSGAVPVVGGIISEASDSLLSAASALKGSVGVYGMLAVLAICLTPFLKIGVQLLLLKACAALCGLFRQPLLCRLVDRLSEAMSLLLGLTGAYSLAAIFCIVLCMKAVGI